MFFVERYNTGEYLLVKCGSDLLPEVASTKLFVPLLFGYWLAVYKFVTALKI